MKKRSHILVLRFSALGDVAMTIPVLRILRTTYPDLKLTVISRPFFAPLFQEIPDIHFLEADLEEKYKGTDLWKLAQKAESLHVDAVADLHHVIRTRAISLFLRFRGVRIARLNKGRSEKCKLTRLEEKTLIPIRSMHHRYADVFDALGYPIDLESYEPPQRKQLSETLLRLMGVAPKKAIGIAPFAAYKGKMYPWERMKEVLSELSATGQYRIFLFGGGANEVQKLDAMAFGFPDVTNIAGKLNLEEELSLISNLDLMVSMDSGNGHLAAIYGIPVITLWGVTHPCLGFKPFGQPEHHQLLSDRNRYPFIPTSVYGKSNPEGYDDVMESISEQSVVDLIKQTLQ